MNKPTIISIGAATQDVFLRGEIFAAHHEKAGEFQEFPMGSKNDISDVTFSTGGGATNAAVTFARHDFPSYFMGRIGHDIAGQAVVATLEHEGVQLPLLSYAAHAGTGYSTLLLAPNGERTILVYRGVSQKFEFQAEDFKGHTPDWFYVSSLTGDLKTLRAITKYAHQHNIKIAINPGHDELATGPEFKECLPHITILSVNKEEAQLIFRGDTIEELVRHAVQHVPVVLITDGPKGSVASDGHKIYQAGMYEDVPVIDRTGAGDAFSSGFTAVMAAGGTIEQAMIFASANSTSVVGQIGAKAGILKADAKLHHMPVVVKPI